MPTKVVLVTGEQGFLGSRLLGALSKSFSVHVFNGDITDRDYCFKRVQEVRPDVIVHLAALSLPKQCEDNPERARLVNVEGTRYLADAAESLGKPVHFLFTSTAQVYDYSELSKGYPMDEQGKITPQNLYAETKRECEILLEEKAQSGNVAVTVLRLFNHVHKSQQSATFMSSVYSQILALLNQNKNEGSITVGNLDLCRELNPVQNLIELFTSLCDLETNYFYQIFNICSGKSRKLRSVAEAFASYYQMKVVFLINPQLLRENDPKVFVGSNQKIKKMLSLEYPDLTDLELVRYFCSDI